VFESVLLYYLYRICKYLCIEFSCSLIGRCFFWTEHFATVTCILVRLYCSVISIMWFSSETLPMVWKNKSISWLRIVTKVVWLCYLVFSAEYFVALLWIFSLVAQNRNKGSLIMLSCFLCRIFCGSVVDIFYVLLLLSSFVWRVSVKWMALKATCDMIHIWSAAHTIFVRWLHSVNLSIS